MWGKTSIMPDPFAGVNPHVKKQVYSSDCSFQVPAWKERLSAIGKVASLETRDFMEEDLPPQNLDNSGVQSHSQETLHTLLTKAGPCATCGRCT